MPQRKMLQLCTRALLLLLPCFGAPASGETSSNFSQCLDFFYNETPPTGIGATGYQPICQRYKNQYRFASLYHRQRRAPLYSAYVLSPSDGKRPKASWMHEPQLAFSHASPEMKPFRIPEDQNVIESQAVLLDYKNSNYTKGHLNPSMHQRTKEDREATFTLTNIVPQRAGSNSGPWNRLENKVLRTFRAFCNSSMYVITGAVPYLSGARRINGRVSVPEYVWSAYCCPAYSDDLPEAVKPFFPTYAAVGRNDRDSGDEIVPVNVKTRASTRGYGVRRMSLETLEGILKQRLALKIGLFHEQCQ
ncbi:endonuclease domain-containing 1 protein-like [Brachionichthys hirsutus]|uniref:endonuclease domain-containing 1 protein-like n=1 Tax=Brachionichthys hirsutus TaxID=412623 RepID=UPI0036043C78